MDASASRAGDREGIRRASLTRPSRATSPEQPSTCPSGVTPGRQRAGLEVCALREEDGAQVRNPVAGGREDQHRGEMAGESPPRSFVRGEEQAVEPGRRLAFGPRDQRGPLEQTELV